MEQDVYAQFLQRASELSEELHTAIAEIFIGLEFGQMFRRFGAEVTIVSRGSLASREDEDVSGAIREVFEGEGIRVLCDANATGVRYITGETAMPVYRPSETTSRLAAQRWAQS